MARHNAARAITWPLKSPNNLAEPCQFAPKLRPHLPAADRWRQSVRQTTPAHRPPKLRPHRIESTGSAVSGCLGGFQPPAQCARCSRDRGLCSSHRCASTSRTSGWRVQGRLPDRLVRDAGAVERLDPAAGSARSAGRAPRNRRRSASGRQAHRRAARVQREVAGAAHHLLDLVDDVLRLGLVGRRAVDVQLDLVGEIAEHWTARRSAAHRLASLRGFPAPPRRSPARPRRGSAGCER